MSLVLFFYYYAKWSYQLLTLNEKYYINKFIDLKNSMQRYDNVMLISHIFKQVNKARYLSYRLSPARNFGTKIIRNELQVLSKWLFAPIMNFVNQIFHQLRRNQIIIIIDLSVSSLKCELLLTPRTDVNNFTTK